MLRNAKRPFFLLLRDNRKISERIRVAIQTKELELRGHFARAANRHFPSLLSALNSLVCILQRVRDCTDHHKDLSDNLFEFGGLYVLDH